jgi:hypothetical protein
MANEKACDGKDHGVTPERQEALNREAVAFNQLLRASDSLPPGPSRDAVIRDANKVLDDFLPKQRPWESSHNLIMDYGDTGEALYHQLIEMPVGERKALIKALTDYNRSMADADKEHRMPNFSTNIDDRGFFSKMHYGYYEVGNWGMCAQFEPPDPSKPSVPSQNDLSFSINPFKLWGRK